MDTKSKIDSMSKMFPRREKIFNQNFEIILDFCILYGISRNKY